MEKFATKKITEIRKDATKLWKTIMIISIVLFLASLVFVFNFFVFKNRQASKKIAPNAEINKEAEKKKSVQECEECVRRNIDGIYVLPEKSNLPAIAIMIDNHFEARPTIGINLASLVYEAEVEGRFTRYMAIFDAGVEAKKIGPVRSARSYFVDWAGEFGAIYAHCGGSPDALVKIIQENISDLNEFYNGQYFWRSKEKKAPYNILTSSDNLNKFLEKKGIDKANFISWKFKDDSPAPSSSSPEIEVNFHHPDFKVMWKYNEANNDYIRYLAGKIHLTSDNKSINAKNIIIQEVPAQVIDNVLRLKMEIIGEGKAIICQDGICQEGEWKKDNARERTVFYQKNGNEAEFNAGQTWIEIVRPDVEIIWQAKENND